MCCVTRGREGGRERGGRGRREGGRKGSGWREVGRGREGGNEEGEAREGGVTVIHTLI